MLLFGAVGKFSPFRFLPRRLSSKKTRILTVKGLLGRESAVLVLAVGS